MAMGIDGNNPIDSWLIVDKLIRLRVDNRENIMERQKRIQVVKLSQ